MNAHHGRKSCRESPLRFSSALRSKTHPARQNDRRGPAFTRTAAVADMFCQIRAEVEHGLPRGLIPTPLKQSIAKDYLVLHQRRIQL